MERAKNALKAYALGVWLFTALFFALAVFDLNSKHYYWEFNWSFYRFWQAVISNQASSIGKDVRVATGLDSATPAETADAWCRLCRRKEAGYDYQDPGYMTFFAGDGHPHRRSIAMISGLAAKKPPNALLASIQPPAQFPNGWPRVIILTLAAYFVISGVGIFIVFISLAPYNSNEYVRRTSPNDAPYVWRPTCQTAGFCFVWGIVCPGLAVWYIIYGIYWSIARAINRFPAHPAESS